MGSDRALPEPPSLIRALLEAVAAQLQVGQGQQRLELIFRDGQLAEWYRHDGPIPAGALERYEP